MRSIELADPVMRVIPQRELRNNTASVLREVEAGTRLRIQSKGKNIADLVPVSKQQTFVPLQTLTAILAKAPLDQGFKKDVDAVLGATVDEIEPR